MPVGGSVTEHQALLDSIRQLHTQIRDTIVAACEQRALEDLSNVAQEAAGDTIYVIDRISEEVLVEFFEKEVAPKAPMVLLAEGLPGGKLVLPRDTSEEDTVWRIIVDPIDGTRGLMYQKRSAWILTGVAPNRGGQTNLSDIQLAIQTEIPLVKQHLSDVLWVTAGQGVQAERFNRVTGESRSLDLRPSKAKRWWPRRSWRGRS